MIFGWTKTDWLERDTNQTPPDFTRVFSGEQIIIHPGTRSFDILTKQCTVVLQGGGNSIIFQWSFYIYTVVSACFTWSMYLFHTKDIHVQCIMLNSALLCLFKCLSLLFHKNKLFVLFSWCMEINVSLNKWKPGNIFWTF